MKTLPQSPVPNGRRSVRVAFLTPGIRVTRSRSLSKYVAIAAGVADR
jgi:hypothetical protein